MFNTLAEAKNTVLIYGLSAFLSLSIVWVAIYLESYFQLPTSLLIFIISPLLSSWYGGVKLGVFSAVLAALGYIYFSPDLYILIPAAVFILVSFLISLTIDKARKFDEIAKHRKKEAQYARLLTNEQKKNIKAQEEIRARDEFLSIASHELRTPLALSLLQIQQALHNIRNVSLAKFSVQSLMNMLESVENQTDRLSKMISDLSNVSLITTGKLRLDPEEMDLTKTISDVIRRVPATLNKEHYPIKIYKNGLVKGKWDKIRIEQMITNLLTNAIKYGNNKPIQVSIEKTDHIARIVVQDQGIGIPKNLQKKIFDRFERAVANKEFQGLGVGLYITNQIINAHRGSIKVSSKEGKGTTFTVELPLNMRAK